MATFFSTSKGGSRFTRGIRPSAPNTTQIIKKTPYFKRLFRQNSRKNYGGHSPRFVEQKSHLSRRKSDLPWLLQSPIPCTKARKQVETGDRSEHFEQTFNHKNIQNGDCRSDPKVPLSGRMALFNRYKRCLPSRPYASKCSEISKVSDKPGCLPICFPTLRVSDRPIRVYDSCEGSEADSKIPGNLNAPILGRLAHSGSVESSMSSRQSKAPSFGSKIGLGRQSSKIRDDSKSKFRFPGISFRPVKRVSFSDSEESRKTDLGYHFLQKDSFRVSKKVNVFHRSLSLSRKNGSSGQTSHSTFPMASEETLEIPRELGKTDSNLLGVSSSSSMVGVSSKHNEGISTTSIGALHIPLHGCVQEGLGCPSGRSRGKWALVPPRDKPSCQSFRAESRLSGSKSFRKRVNTPHSLSLFRQLFSGVLPQQARRNQVSPNGSNDLENLCLVQNSRDPGSSQTRTRVSQRHCRQPIPEGQGYPDRVVSEPKGISSDLSNMALSPNRHVCHISKCQAQSIHFPNPGPKGLGNRCSQRIMGPPERICLQSRCYPPTGSSKTSNLSVSDDSNRSGLARDGLVLGSCSSVNQAPPETTSVEDTVEATTQPVSPQKLRVPKPARVASRVKSRQSPRFSASVENRVRAPQRQSSRAVYSARWSLFRTWCEENQVDVSSPSIPRIADFLLYLFESKNLKPATITGYRTAIADGLGSDGQAVSSSRELNRLLASFYRDRPRVDRGIPSWDLSLVLLALTKSPFEPLRQADLKYLTFKTVFLMALASGKRRGEMHAWTHSSVFFNSDSSKVTVAPSPVFLAKNQLASDGPGSIKPVVIPALAPTLDTDLREDRSLCPVRALRVYLDRTKDSRQGKNLLFVSIRKNFSKDISKNTISQWIKNTIKLCYTSADSETLQVTRVKAHDVRALSASLAFKGGIPLEEILTSCYWKSHGTFMNFYLKDVCWSNDEIFKLGPLVAAQHVVSSK